MKMISGHAVCLNVNDSFDPFVLNHQVLYHLPSFHEIIDRAAVIRQERLQTNEIQLLGLEKAREMTSSARRSKSRRPYSSRRGSPTRRGEFVCITGQSIQPVIYSRDIFF
mmetsp:Transcript_36456/g.95935  ORF Transcript_36456/g.95935 Transcript_36456/m.95935 type:complete len:110 (+) Transcript_36456:7904-8233(+)